jgi:hypothetical protein
LIVIASILKNGAIIGESEFEPRFSLHFSAEYDRSRLTIRIKKDLTVV